MPNPIPDEIAAAARAALDKLIAEAVQAEREACAKVAELAPHKRDAMICGCAEGLAEWTAAAIRARGDTEKGER